MERDTGYKGSYMAPGWREQREESREKREESREQRETRVELGSKKDFNVRIRRKMRRTCFQDFKISSRFQDFHMISRFQGVYLALRGREILVTRPLWCTPLL